MPMFVEGQDPLNAPGAPAPERAPIGAPEPAAKRGRLNDEGSDA